LVETQFSTKIKKLKIDNSSEYVNKDMSAFLETTSIIHDLLPLYINESNGLPEHINWTIVTIDRLMTLDYANVHPQILWAEAASMAIYIRTATL
jgi:hypothetical protein